MVKEKIQKPTLETLAASLYIDLPYHNFQHALRAATIGQEICSRCLQEGVIIDPQVVYCALLFHDAGYHEDCKQKGFSSKEEYSAYLAGEALLKLGKDQDFILQVQRAIISTNRDAPFVTNEEKAVRAADLAEIAGDYQRFLENNKLLKQEFELMNKQKASWEDWKKSTQKIIEFYLSQDIHLTSAYTDSEGRSIFHQQTRANLERFLSESTEKLDQI